jgi:hypothetical protein
MKPTPLWMLPNGFFIRQAEEPPEGGVIVEEPDLPDVIEIEDQTDAVLGRTSNDSQSHNS